MKTHVTYHFCLCRTKTLEVGVFLLIADKIITNNLLDQYFIILTMNNMTILLTKDGCRKPAPCIYNDVCMGKHDKHSCTPKTSNLHLKIFSKSVDIK